jgi:hypothetical protein
MPDPNSPTANHEPEATPVEFDFIAPAAENPRMKRRSLKAKSATVLKPLRETTPEAPEIAREAPPRTEPAATRPAPADEDDNAAVEIKETPPPAAAKAKTSSPSSRPHFASTARPSSPTPKPTSSSPHGTRPATLYYSTGPRKEKEKVEPVTPMSTTPAASTTSAPASATRPTAAAVRPATVVDYRTNVDRQAREQKSVGGVLSIIVYVLIGFFVLTASLAGYGTYALSKQIHKQSLTIDDLNTRYNAETDALTAKIATANDNVTQVQAQSQAQEARLQDLIVKQQDSINKLIAADNAATSALHTERQTRAEETASLRARLRNLEYKGPGTSTTTQRY